MTCIIGAGGVIAADMQRVGPHKCSVTKIWHHEGSIFADAGDATWGEIFQEWYIDGQNRDRREAIAKLMNDMGGDWVGLQIKPDGKIVMWAVPFIPLPMHTEVYAIGSGAPYALGAYSSGKSLIESVAIAHLWDEYTGAEVQTISLDDVAHKKKRRGK